MKENLINKSKFFSLLTLLGIYSYVILRLRELMWCSNVLFFFMHISDIINFIFESHVFFVFISRIINSVLKTCFVSFMIMKRPGTFFRHWSIDDQVRIEIYRINRTIVKHIIYSFNDEYRCSIRCAWESIEQ
jgi:hypothetical protein